MRSVPIKENLFILFAVLFLVAVFGALLLAYQLLANDGIDSANSTDFGTNSSGQTYGSSEGIYDFADLPDLIRVMTVCGEEGYVFAKELEEASGTFMTGDELSARQLEWEKKSAAFFVDSLQAELEILIPALTNTDKVEIFDLARSADGMNALIHLDCFEFTEEEQVEKQRSDARQQLISKIETLSSLDTDLPSDVTFSESIDAFLNRRLSSLLFEAMQVNTIYIPVYDVEAETIIGEFPVG